MRAKGKEPKDDKWKAKYKEPASTAQDDLARLPGSWRWTSTGELGDSIVPNRDKPKSFTGDIPWVTIPDLKQGLVLTRSISGEGLTREEVEKYRARLIPKNAVIMSCVGRFGIASVLERAVVINQQLHAFVLPEGVAPKYLV